MFISNLACGEVKIALDCCRELGSISQENRKHLPKTLGDRLQIFAFFKKNQVREIERIDICQKCQDTWLVFEALYWALRESGLNMALTEKLNRAIRL
jgi:hypothetical protein